MNVFLPGKVRVLMMCHGGSWPCRGGGRPRKERPVIRVNISPSHPLTTCNLLLMLHRMGAWTPKTKPAHFVLSEMLPVFQQEAIASRGLSEDSEVWPLVETFGVSREHADEAAMKQLPGSLFCWGYDVDAFKRFDAQSIPERRLCMDPALSLGLMARINGNYYQADRSPDYTIGHLVQLAPTFSDPRLSGEALYPLWVEQENSRPKSKKRSA